MNILIVVSSLGVGGAEKQVVLDANLLSGSHKVIVLAFRDGPLSAQLSPNVELVIKERKGYLSAALHMSQLIRKHKVDCIHAHLYAPMVISAFAGQMTSVTVIWNFHSHAYENSLKGKLLHKYSAKLGAVRKILFPAAELDEYYAKEGYGFSRKKTMPGFNSGQFMGGQFHEKKEANPVHIGFVGRIIPLKRVDYLIDLAIFLRENCDVPFVIDVVGDGTELPRLQTLAKEKQVEDKVLFHGFREDTRSFYSMFDIFALPSGEEVLSLSLIDAGLAGLPSVAFRVGGNHEIIVDFSTGFLVESKEQFFSTILKLIGDQDLREIMGKAASAYTFEKFSPEARLIFLERIYAQVV